MAELFYMLNARIYITNKDADVVGKSPLFVSPANLHIQYSTPWSWKRKVSGRLTSRHPFPELSLSMYDHKTLKSDHLASLIFLERLMKMFYVEKFAIVIKNTDIKNANSELSKA